MYTVSQVVALIACGREVYTEVGGRRTRVLVAGGSVRRAYIRTVPNDSVEDNLLSLPTF